MLIGLETFIILSEEQTNFDTSSAGHWTSSSHPRQPTQTCVGQGRIFSLLSFCLYRGGKPIDPNVVNQFVSNACCLQSRPISPNVVC